MQISHVRICNILGIEELEFSPEGFNKFSGRNGTGKTSVLEAIKAAIKGGHDATLLRNGAEKGEVVLVLDDGTEVRKRVTQATSTTDVVKGGKKVPKPQAALQALTDMLSVNPVEFLTAPAKDRVRVLLESMPLQVDAARLTKIAGFDVKPAPGVHALHVIDQVHKAVYDARTGTNRAVREKDGTINQLRQALPPEGAGLDGDEVSLQTRLEEVDAALAAETGRINTKLDGLAQTKNQAIAEKRKQILDLERAINELEATHTRVEGLASTQRVKAITKHGEETAPIKAKLKAIRDDRESYARRQQTLDTIGALETELEGLQVEAERQTQSLTDIEAYKLELLGALPVQGLEVRDGELFLDGVPFDRLNTARQVDVAVEIAKLRAGDLGVICVDRIEALDSATLDAFRERALESELQLFVTRVSDEEFSIESES